MSNIKTLVQKGTDKIILDFLPAPLAKEEGITAQQLQYMMDAITRMGSDVIQLRSEVDYLTEQNIHLQEMFQKLKLVMSEKNYLNIDDFELACDVLSSIYDQPGMPVVKKYTS